jgi:hypothetical protein
VCQVHSQSHLEVLSLLASACSNMVTRIISKLRFRKRCAMLQGVKQAKREVLLVARCHSHSGSTKPCLQDRGQRSGTTSALLARANQAAVLLGLRRSSSGPSIGLWGGTSVHQWSGSSLQAFMFMFANEFGRGSDGRGGFVEGLREESLGHVLRRAHPLTTLP